MWLHTNSPQKTNNKVELSSLNPFRAQGVNVTLINGADANYLKTTLNKTEPEHLLWFYLLHLNSSNIFHQNSLFCIPLLKPELYKHEIFHKTIHNKVFFLSGWLGSLWQTESLERTFHWFVFRVCVYCADKSVFYRFRQLFTFSCSFPSKIKPREGATVPFSSFSFKCFGVRLQSGIFHQRLIQMKKKRRQRGGERQWYLV